MGEGKILGTMLARGLAVCRLSRPLKVLILCFDIEAFFLFEL